MVVVLTTIDSCKKENQATTNVCPATVTDIDGNVYNTLKIGNQCWMQQNLKTTHYRDGSEITEIEDSSSWANAQTQAWCYYNGDAASNTSYGKLYNWYAVTDPSQLCPAGWHVPSDTEWHTLALTLDSTATWFNGVESAFAGGEMKAITLWLPQNTDATNSSGFTALPAGDRYNNGGFPALGSYSGFWSSTQVISTSSAWSRGLNYWSGSLYRGSDEDVLGHSVRCVGD